MSKQEWRITSHGDYQVRKGRKWVRPGAGQIDQAKLRRWAELSKNRKKEKKEETRE